jgi:septal ring factor EnvC (AmiA/AmiB activator)
VKKFDEQETQIERLHDELRKVRDEEAAQRKRMQEYINSIQID